MSRKQWGHGYHAGYKDALDGFHNTCECPYSHSELEEIKHNAWDLLKAKKENKSFISDEDLLKCIESVIFSHWVRSGGGWVKCHPSKHEFSCHWVKANQFNLPFLYALFENYEAEEKRIYEILIKKYPNPRILKIKHGMSCYIMA